MDKRAIEIIMKLDELTLQKEQQQQNIQLCGLYPTIINIKTVKKMGYENSRAY